MRPKGGPRHGAEPGLKRDGGESVEVCVCVCVCGLGKGP